MGAAATVTTAVSAAFDATAMIFALPCCTPVTTPLDDTEACCGSDELHWTGCPSSTRPVRVATVAERWICAPTAALAALGETTTFAGTLSVTRSALYPEILRYFAYTVAEPIFRGLT